ncbi:hypothetical protein LCGC14_1452300, partial [marine sediment metagenome]
FIDLVRNEILVAPSRNTLALPAGEAGNLLNSHARTPPSLRENCVYFTPAELKLAEPTTDAVLGWTEPTIKHLPEHLREAHSVGGSGRRRDSGQGPRFQLQQLLCLLGVFYHPTSIAQPEPREKV